MTNFRETKIKILSEEHSRAFQEAVFAAGGRWRSAEEGVMYLYAKFLFVGADLKLGFEYSDRDYFDSHKNTEIQFPIPTKGHNHAELMAQYAEDAKSHAEPWKLWLSKTGESLWRRCQTTPLWDPSSEYRREPKTHIVHGVEIPDLRFTPRNGDWYYAPIPHNPALAARSIHSNTDEPDAHRSKHGLCYEDSEEGKQAAILHAKVWLGCPC